MAMLGLSSQPTRLRRTNDSFEDNLLFEQRIQIRVTHWPAQHTCLDGRGNRLLITSRDFAAMATQEVRNEVLNFPRHAVERRCRLPKMDVPDAYTSFPCHVGALHAVSKPYAA
jgi:hypothetical protein